MTKLLLGFRITEIPIPLRLSSPRISGEGRFNAFIMRTLSQTANPPEGEVLINGFTGKLGTGSKMSGYPKTQRCDHSFESDAEPLVDHSLIHYDCLLRPTPLHRSPEIA